MQEPDRKVLWALAFALAVIALELAWFLFVGPANHGHGATAQAAANAASDQDYPWWEYSGAWIAVFTIVLTLSTAALWWTTQQTLAHAEKSSERQLRAYVDVKEVKFDDTELLGKDAIEGRRLQVQINIRNFGQTPAKDLTTWSRCEFVHGDAPPQIVRPKGISAPRSVPPGGFYSHRLFKDCGFISYTALGTGTAAFWVFGEIRYKDAFGGEQETDFLFKVGGEVRLHGGTTMARASFGNRAT
jgi:hypothetical protein